MTTDNQSNLFEFIENIHQTYGITTDFSKYSYPVNNYELLVKTETMNNDNAERNNYFFGFITE